MPRSAQTGGVKPHAKHRRRRRYPLGLALGLVLVVTGSVALVVTAPPPERYERTETSGTTASSPSGVGPDDPPEEEPPVLLRSVVEEVSTAEGELEVVEGRGRVMGEGPLTTFAVEVEEGLPGDPEDFTAAVEEILGDPRSWGNDGVMSLQRVDSPDADILVALAAPDTVDELCYPLRTNGFVSCAVGNRAVINQNRWVSGVDHFDGDLETYRIYLINHEVGHTLGYGHVNCPGEGEPAPVMQQQSLGLQGCEPNGWVYP